MTFTREPTSCTITVIGQFLHLTLNNRELNWIERNLFSVPRLATLAQEMVKEVGKRIKDWIAQPSYVRGAVHTDENRYHVDYDMYYDSKQSVARKAAIALEAKVRTHMWEHRADWGAGAPPTHYVLYFTERQFQTKRIFTEWSTTLKSLGWSVEMLGESVHRDYNVGIAMRCPPSNPRWK